MAYRYIQEVWKQKHSDCMRYALRLRSWEARQGKAIVRLNRPSRVDKARRLGYRAKQGFSVFRVRIRRGGRKRQVQKGIVWGKPKHQGIQIKRNKNLQVIAEVRMGKRAPNLRVLQSYWVCQDARFKFYEVIMVDPQHAAIQHDPKINWICQAKHNHREDRGKTGAGQKHRGLRSKSRLNKVRPSVSQNWRRRQKIQLHRYR